MKLQVGGRSPLVGRPLRFLREGRDLAILSHRRHNREAVLFPPEDTVLAANDRVAVLARSSTIGELHRLNQDQPA